MRWGKHIHAGKPCSGQIAVMPHQLASALGLGLPSTDEGLSGPVRVSGENFDVLQFQRISGKETLIDREYWVERYPPFMVRRIVFRDEYGRDSMQANLDDYRSGWQGGPLVPLRIDVRWPRTDSRLRMEISGVKAMPADKISPKAFTLPKPAELPAGVRDIVQVDAPCDTPAGNPPS